MKAKHLIFSLLLSLFVQSTLSRPTKEPEPEQWITVLIHGIINIQPHITFSNIFRFVRDETEDTIYERAIELIRTDPHYFQFQPMQGMGLVKVDTSVAKPGATASAFAQLYDKTSCIGCTKKRNNTFYTFGWTGRYSAKSWLIESQELYDSLAKEITTLVKQGIKPKVRIIGYSHGGNLALNLGRLPGTKKKRAFTVDELLLVGAPVIHDNKEGIMHPIFKKIYHFYSPGDRVAGFDFVLGNLFAGKTFEAGNGFTPPQKLIQIEYRLKRVAFNPHDKKPRTFHMHRLRNADPGHTEWWSFGWIYNYRNYLPIYPLPASVFLTYLTDRIDELHPKASRITADIHPVEEKVHFVNQKTSATKVTPFIEFAQLNELKQLAKKFKPVNFSRNTLDNLVDVALKQATKEKSLQWGHQRAIRKKLKRQLSLKGLKPSFIVAQQTN